MGTPVPSVAPTGEMPKRRRRYGNREQRVGGLFRGSAETPHFNRIARSYGRVSELCIHTALCGYITGSRSCCARERYVPWQQLADLADGVIGDLGEDVVEIEFRVEPIELG